MAAWRAVKNCLVAVLRHAATVPKAMSKLADFQRQIDALGAPKVQPPPRRLARKLPISESTRVNPPSRPATVGLCAVCHRTRLLAVFLRDGGGECYGCAGQPAVVEFKVAPNVWIRKVDGLAISGAMMGGAVEDAFRGGALESELKRLLAKGEAKTSTSTLEMPSSADGLPW